MQIKDMKSEDNPIAVLPADKVNSDFEGQSKTNQVPK